MASRRPTIGILTGADSQKRGRTHSSIAFFMARALQRNCGEVVHLGPVLSPVELAGKVANRFARRVLHRPCDFNDTWLQAWDWARIFAKRLSGLDILLNVQMGPQFALLETDIPIIYASDATFELVRDYYPFYSHLPRWNVRQGEAIEGCALERAALFTVPSRWAAASARDHYGVPPDKIRIISRGGNLDEVPPEHKATAPRLQRATCRLLFVAVEWERKGGDIAYDTLCALRERGVDASLIVVGCEPPASVNRSSVRVIRYLDKEVPSHRAALSQLFLSSHFLLLPTRAECTPRVFSEASAHGTPSIAADTGGVSGAIFNGENGFLLPPTADGCAYAALVAELLEQPERYEALVASSRRAYDQRLNWDAWARAVGESISELLAARGLSATAA